MTYLIIARDGNDPEAKARRLAVREEHLEGIKPAVASAILKMGGAIVDDDGEMVGSAMLVEAASREALERFLTDDIYSRAGVWLEFEIYPFRQAV